MFLESCMFASLCYDFLMLLYLNVQLLSNFSLRKDLKT